MKLYLVHCGYYDPDLCDGVYEGHANFFVAAASFEEARQGVRLLPGFAARRMHVDSIQEIEAVGGYRVRLEPDASLEGTTRLVSHRHRELAPKPA